jgi:hypothetical protein
MLAVPALVTSAWTVLQPYLPILATKAAEEIGKKVPEVAARLWAAIKGKVETRPAAKEALTDLLKSPEDGDLQATFRVQLKKLLEEDQSFAAELSKLLESAGSDYKAQLIGSGAIAQGNGAKAVGAGGIMIGGSVTGNINSGKKNEED